MTKPIDAMFGPEYERLASQEEEIGRLKAERDAYRDIVERMVEECEDTFHDPGEDMAPEWRRLYQDARDLLTPPPKDEQECDEN